MIELKTGLAECKDVGVGVDYLRITNFDGSGFYGATFEGERAKEAVVIHIDRPFIDIIVAGSGECHDRRQ